MENFRVICVNDKAMPKGFPAECWIKKGETYTVVDAKILLRQHNTIGYSLAEISIPEYSEYKFFLSNRFVFLSDNDELAAEAAVEELLDEVLELKEV